MKTLKSFKINKMIIFGAIATLAFILILNRSNVAIEYMKKGLNLCSKTVIPSLFPFMVISDLIVSSGVGIGACKPFARPMKAVFGVSEAGGCAFILGAVCGFPIGARTAVSMYDGGLIDKDELTHILTFCNNPGSAFIISAVGVSLFGNRKIGNLLYLCVILSAVTVGILGRLFFKTKRKKATVTLCSPPQNSGIELFTSAIQNSAVSMLTVCAYVAFFSSLIGCLGAILRDLGVSEVVCAAIFGFFELSSGVGIAAEAVSSTKAVIMCAAIAGWSGLSVHFQIMTICSGRGISFKPYFFAKVSQGILCALFMGICLRFYSPFVDLNSEIFATVQTVSLCDSTLICLLFFAASAFPVVLEMIKAKNFQKKR
jgi:sporulation integral membrane protein YlbJ